MAAQRLLAAADAFLDLIRPYLSWNKSRRVSPPEVVFPCPWKTERRVAVVLHLLVTGFHLLPALSQAAFFSANVGPEDSRLLSRHLLVVVSYTFPIRLHCLFFCSIVMDGAIHSHEKIIIVPEKNETTVSNLSLDEGAFDQSVSLRGIDRVLPRIVYRCMDSTSPTIWVHTHGM